MADQVFVSPSCDCGFWRSLLGEVHQEGACDALAEAEREMVLKTYDSKTDSYPGATAFDEWLDAHLGDDGLLVFTDEELAPYRD